MIFEQIPVGGDRNFAYLIGDDRTRHAAVVDPAFRPEEVLDRAASKGLEILYLINTHGHYDHADGNSVVLSRTKARLIAGGAGGVADGEKISLGGIELTLIHTPGHTAGSQCVLISTNEGIYNLTGDTIHILPIAFPKMTEWTLMDGKKLPITPAPIYWGPAVPSSLVYDHYAWFKSIYRIQSLFRDPEFYLPGHETSIVGKSYG